MIDIIFAKPAIFHVVILGGGIFSVELAISLAKKKSSNIISVTS